MYKIMIVDDEPVIRKGLSNLINWELYNCEIVFQAFDGINAMENINAYMPDIVITDIRMPSMDGLELAQHINNEHPHIKTIILTGYADFNYAQTAIKYNVISFILKPTTEEKITSALKKAIVSIESEKKDKYIIKKLMENEKMNLHIRQENLLQKIIQEIISIDDNTITKLNKLNISLTHFYILRFKLSDIDNFEDDLNQNTTKNVDINAFKNLIATAFQDINYYMTYINNHDFILLVTFEDDNPIHFDNVMAICNEIVSLFNNFMNHKINIGVSNNHNSPMEIKIAIKEAKNTLDDLFYEDVNSFVFTHINKKSNNQSVINKNQIDLLIESLQVDDENIWIETFTTLFQELVKDGFSSTEIKDVCIYISSRCFGLISNYNATFADVSIKLNNIYFNILNASKVSKLQDIMIEMIVLIGNYLNTQNSQINHIIKEADIFLKNNYFEPISLSTISNRLHVNSSYLSRLYKKEKGITITEALTSIRIKKAKELLKFSQYKIFEIAELVGIEDPAYFSQLFKKNTGKSPKEYRTINS